MNSNMVKPEKSGHLHLVYYFKIHLTELFLFNTQMHCYSDFTVKLEQVLAPKFLYTGKNNTQSQKTKH